MNWRVSSLTDGLVDLDSDLWIEACVVCDRSDNHGNAVCAGCEGDG